LFIQPYSFGSALSDTRSCGRDVADEFHVRRVWPWPGVPQPAHCSMKLTRSGGTPCRSAARSITKQMGAEKNKKEKKRKKNKNIDCYDGNQTNPNTSPYFTLLLPVCR